MLKSIFKKFISASLEEIVNEIIGIIIARPTTSSNKPINVKKDSKEI